MTYSPLTNEVMPPTGRYNGGVKWQARPAGVRINGLNVHHHAATSEAGITRLVTSNDPASANYIIRNSGSLIGSVPEEFRAWTTSSYAADADKVTVEIQNQTGAPDWRISDAALGTLIRLYADLARRYGFAPVRANLKGHQEYGIATACPGPYLLPRLDYVAQTAATLDTPTTTEEDMTFTDEDRAALAATRQHAANAEKNAFNNGKAIAALTVKVDELAAAFAAGGVDETVLAGLVVPQLGQAVTTVLTGGTFVTTTETAATFIPAIDAT